MAAPIKKYRSGPVSCAVWEREYKGDKVYSFSFQTSYKDKEGKWVNSDFFKHNDLSHVKALCDYVFHKTIMFNENKAPAPPKAEPQSPEPKPKYPAPVFPDKGPSNDEIPF